MADISGQFYRASKVREGTSPSSPGVIVGEPVNPVNPIGSGGGGETFFGVGAGLSIDVDNKIQLGNDGAGVIDYSDTSVFPNGVSFLYGDLEKSLSFELKDGEAKTQTLWDDGIDSYSSYVQVQSDSLGSRIDLVKTINGLDQSIIFDPTTNLIAITDTINNKGLENAGDYEANFTARSLVTKQYVTSAIGAINVLATPLTGYIVGANTALSATDTILQAFQKTQGQINARVSGTIANGQVAFGTGVNTIGGNSGFTYSVAGGAYINMGAANGGMLLDGTSGFNRQIIYSVGGVNRWIQNVNQNSYIISRYNSSGGFVDNPLTISSSNGFFGIGSITATNTLDVNGTARIRSISNGTGDFLTKSATGVITSRTSAEVRTDIGAVSILGPDPLDWNLITTNGWWTSHTTTLNVPVSAFGSGQSHQYNSTNGWQYIRDRGLTSPIYHRGLANGIFGSWSRIWDDRGITTTQIATWDSLSDKFTSLYTDLNNVVKTSFFKGVNSGLLNPPTGLSAFVSGISSLHAEDSNLSGWQIATDRSSLNGFQYRKVLNGTWSSWIGLQDKISGTLTNGYIATIVSGIPTWSAPVSSSKWTDVGIGNIYRNSSVSIGQNIDPTETIDINGTARIRTIANGTGDFLTKSATGVITSRTATEVITDLGLATNYVTIATAQTITGAKIFSNALLVQEANTPILRLKTANNTQAIINFRNSANEDQGGLQLDAGTGKLSLLTRTSNTDIEIFPHGTGSILLPNVASGTGDVLMLNGSNEVVKGSISPSTNYKLLDEDITPTAFTSATFATILTGGILGTNSFDGAVDSSYKGRIVLRSLSASSYTFNLRFTIWGQNIDVAFSIGAVVIDIAHFIDFELIIQGGVFLLTGITRLIDAPLTVGYKINSPMTTYSATGTSSLDIQANVSSPGNLYLTSFLLQQYK